MNYVMHFCRNKQCNNGWVDEDLTNAKTTPPNWKYCRECANKLGIDYDAQTPTSNLTQKELERQQRLKELSQKAIKKRWNRN